jgi:hypothetical protein
MSLANSFPPLPQENGCILSYAISRD